MTIRETAATGILSENFLRQMVKRHECPGVQVGNSFRVNVEQIQRAEKGETKIKTEEERYENLANAIILQAVEDYRSVLRYEEKDKDKLSKYLNKDELEAFFFPSGTVRSRRLTRRL